jgi:hypothetical protein
MIPERSVCVHMRTCKYLRMYFDSHTIGTTAADAQLCGMFVHVPCDRCVSMRMPCQPSLRLADELKKKHPTEEEEEEIKDQYHVKKVHRGLEIAR